MKKLLSKLALVGVFAGLVATSYSLPAAAATPDKHTQYTGSADMGIIVIIIGDDYVVVWLEGNAEANAAPGTLASAASDKLFDAQ
ncbi:MAG: hypothetical protein ABIY55_31695 [Kofleriaceae bacterium]